MKLSSQRAERKRMKRNEPRLKDLWDTVKFSDMSIIGFPEEEESEK